MIGGFEEFSGPSEGGSSAGGVGTGGAMEGSGGTMTGGGSGGSPGTCDVDGSGPGDVMKSEWAQWPMPRPATDEEGELPHPADYEIHDEVVIDRVTGLMWQRQEASFPDWDPPTWLEAMSYCEELSLAGDCTWRVPTLIELVSLVDYAHVEPAIDTEAFPDARSTGYWSSSQQADGSGLVWIIPFQHGGTRSLNPTSGANVRCVASGGDGSVASPNYEVEDQVVIDSKTGLTWQSSSFGPVDWVGAHEYCETLGLGAGGWRLPSMKELQTLIHRRREDAPLIHTETFPETKFDVGYWTSSPVMPNEGVRWYVSFENGHVGLGEDGVDQLLVRCVRSGSGSPD